MPTQKSTHISSSSTMPKVAAINPRYNMRIQDMTLTAKFADHTVVEYDVLSQVFYCSNPWCADRDPSECPHGPVLVLAAGIYNPGSIEGLKLRRFVRRKAVWRTAVERIRRRIMMPVNRDDSAPWTILQHLKKSNLQ